MLPPMGDWDIENWEEIMENNLPDEAAFWFVPQYLVQKWQAQLPAQITVEEHGAFDYLYHLDKQIDAEGKAFREFRRQLRQFNELYQYEAREITPEDLPEVKQIQAQMIEKFKAAGRYDESLQAENAAFDIALAHWKDLNLKDLLFHIEGETSAFFIWEELDGATAIALYAKFDHTVKNLYAQMRYDVYAILSERGYSLVNQMCDEDEAGMRRTKLEQLPLVLMKKNKVTYRKGARA